MVDLSLYLVAGESLTHSMLRDAVSGGVSIVQLRCKQLSDRELITFARPILAMCDELGVPLILNDRVDIALAIGANGVHLGVDDLPIEAARSISPPGFIIGYSPETDAQARTAAERGADYLGVGPFAETTTKLDAGPALEEVDFAKRVAMTSLPVVGIGGITTLNAPRVIACGAVGVAVSSAILTAQDATEAARALRMAVH